MKSLKLAIPALLLISGSAFGAIDTTSHNLAGEAGAGDNGESAASYTVYSSTTMDQVAGQPGAKSDACLSCHDGTLAYDNIVNAPGLGSTIAGTNTMTGVALVGTDLSNDHPIGIDITAAGGVAGGITESGGSLSAFLEVNIIECSTCHDVHDDTEGSFLRVTNSASALCTQCHIK